MPNGMQLYVIGRSGRDYMWPLRMLIGVVTSLATYICLHRNTLDQRAGLLHRAL